MNTHTTINWSIPKGTHIYTNQFLDEHLVESINFRSIRTGIIGQRVVLEREGGAAGDVFKFTYRLRGRQWLESEEAVSDMSKG